MRIDKQSYRETVESLLQNTDQRTPPINISRIANDLGIMVLETSMPEPDVSGFIVKRDDGQICIYVNEDDSITRQRFTIAHELAHYYLHYRESNGVSDKKGILDFVKFRNGVYDEGGRDEEKQANAFAAELLVPFNALRELWEAGHMDAAFLANRFAVSTEMMINRLKSCVKDLNKTARY